MSDYERNRLFTLHHLNALDMPASEGFGRMTRMATRVFDVPISAISFTDEHREWFKSHVGIEAREIPRFDACRAEVTDYGEAFVLEDLLESPR